MSGSLNAILVLSYFPYSYFPGLLVCDGGDFGEMHTTKIVFLQILQGLASNQANVTGLFIVISDKEIMFSVTFICLCEYMRMHVINCICDEMANCIA